MADDGLVHVDVRGPEGRLDGARVTVRPQEDGDDREVPWDNDRQQYVAEIPPGAYVIVVEAGGLRREKRKITVGPSGGDELFILGREDQATIFRGRVRVPIDVDPDLVAIYVPAGVNLDLDEYVRVAAERLGIDPERLPEGAEQYGVRMFRVPRPNQSDVLPRLKEESKARHAGAVVVLNEEAVSFLTGDIVVKFRNPTRDAVRGIAKDLGLELTRSELPYSPGTFVFGGGPSTLELLDVIERLVSRDDVEWAEPDLVTNPVLDAVTPTDYCWAGLWDRQLIGLPDAWQTLQDNAIPAFGNPGIVIAVMDSGTQSSGGAPTNPDFQGTVSDGSTKVVAAYDFGAMVANNDTPWDPHGSGVAGVVSGRANNASPILGQNAGVAGSAPNCRLITMQSGGSESNLCDAFIWSAGFDPESPVPTFPAPPPVGAAVTTCSLGLGAGLPLSGVAKAMLDFMTTFGRGGKGCMCFFSTGNGNSDNLTNRPYSAYEKAFGIAASTLDNTGTNEIRAPYSGHGRIALCAPSHDQYPVFHNPPTGYAVWSAHHLNASNIIGWPAITTTLTAASVVGATALTVASVAGLAVNQVLHVGPIGVNGSEPARITAINAATETLTVQGWSGAWGGGLVAAHGAGSPVAQGPAHWQNYFGGTSSATPLTAGVAALVLSAEPTLTWVEARQILRDTAVKFDLTNTNSVGQWLDAMGNPSNVSGQPPVRSGWYGYGRVDADSALATAVAWTATRDLVVRDNLADTGTVASAGAFWNSPDLWVRTMSPATDPSPQPPNYATAGPHQSPIRGQDNWIYVRVRNNGTQPSLDAWVRVSVTHFPGMEFTYPGSWQPTTPGGATPVTPLAPGTYLIGEVKISGLAMGADQSVSILWPSSLIPPETVMVGPTTVTWHPCLLAEVTPHDGPSPTGNHVWDDNNLAQKNISIVNADSGTDFAVGMVSGNEDNKAEYILLEVNRGRLPKEVTLYLDLANPVLLRRLRKFQGERRRDWRIGHLDGREVVVLGPQPKVRVPILGGPGALVPLVVGGTVAKHAKAGNYSIVLIQRSPALQLQGSAQLSLTIRAEAAVPAISRSTSRSGERA